MREIRVELFFSAKRVKPAAAIHLYTPLLVLLVTSPGLLPFLFAPVRRS